jgi:hypothetical protein
MGMGRFEKEKKGGWEYMIRRNGVWESMIEENDGMCNMKVKQECGNL